jgi:predicted permease
MSIGGFNIGLFAFPIVEGIWGAEGLQYIAMFDIGNALIILGVGYFIGDYYSPLRLKESKIDVKYVLGLFFKSLPFVSYLLAILLNYFSISLPSLADTLFETVAKANMPLVLLLLGVYFNLTIDKKNMPQIWQVILMRYILGIFVGLLLYFLLPFNALYRTMILLGLTLPIGLTIIPFSDKFGYNTEMAASMANISIVISFVLMWLIVSFLG